MACMPLWHPERPTLLGLRQAERRSQTLTPAEKPAAPQAKEIKPTTVYSGAHDRVQAVSVNSNGTAAQVHPELLGDYTASVAEQFRVHLRCLLYTSPSPRD